MKDPYELRVIAEALERWTEGPAIDAMKYAAATLREIADEVDASMAKLVIPEVKSEQPIPSAPAGAAAQAAAEVPQENPTPPAQPVVLGAEASATPVAATPVSPEPSPVTSTSTPAASSPAPDTGVSASSTEPSTDVH